MQKKVSNKTIWSTTRKRSASIVRTKPKRASILSAVSASVGSFTKERTKWISTTLFKKPAEIELKQSSTEPKKLAKGVEYKVFKPAVQRIVTEQIKQKIPLKKQSKKTFTLGVKSVNYLKQIHSFSPKGVVHFFKYHIERLRIFERFNQFMFGLLVLSTLLFVVYLSVFDTFFLVKTYSVSFNQNDISQSYLDQDETQSLIQSMKDQKFLGIVPSNQLWFLNSSNVSFIGQKINPQIETIEVKRRIWPNVAELSITTKPILLTLAIQVSSNENEYWRIAPNGSVISKDDAGLREKLVIVEKPVQYNRVGKSLKDITFEYNTDQLNRFWYTDWLLKELQPYNLDILNVKYPSLFDNDVFIELANGTILKFNHQTTSKEAEQIRIKEFLNNPEFGKQVTQSELQYVDFRISKKLFVCKKGLECK
jgi:hypothetical protein